MTFKRNKRLAELESRLRKISFNKYARGKAFVTQYQAINSILQNWKYGQTPSEEKLRRLEANLTAFEEWLVRRDPDLLVQAVHES